MKTQINTTINIELKKLAIKEGVKINEALEFGVTWKLAEKYVVDYPTCSIFEKIKFLQTELEKANKEIEQLTKQEQRTPEQECEEVFGDLKNDF